MKYHFCLLSLVAITSVTCQINPSGCDECNSMYLDWVRNRTRNTYWESHPSAVAAGDHICQWATDIFDGCYGSCGMDMEGNQVAVTSLRGAKGLRLFMDQHCLEGECRLADSQRCFYVPSRKRKCDPTALECSAAFLDEKGCDSNRLCTSAERRAFGQSILDRLSCSLNYPGNKKEGRTYTLTEEQGLQQCKDIIIVECLRSWSESTYDLKHFTNYSDDTKQSFCGAKESAIQCLYDVSNGTVDYSNHEYTTPCKAELLKTPEIVEEVREEVMYAYGKLCSGHDVCTTAVHVETTTATLKSDEMEHDHSEHDDHDHTHDETPKCNEKNCKKTHITDLQSGRNHDSSGSAAFTFHLFLLFSTVAVVVL